MGYNMKKILLLTATTLMFSSCFTISEIAKAKYKTTPSSEYIENGEQLKQAPTSITVLGHTLTAELVDNFDSMETVETNWNTMSDDYLRRGPNFWSNDALSIAEGNYLKIETKAVAFKEMGIDLTEDIKNTCNIDSIEDQVIISGAISTKKTYKYGLFVGRLRLNKETNGHWHAFWSYIHGIEETGFDEKIGYEFDVFEFHRMDADFPNDQGFDQTTHYNYGDSRHSFKHFHTAPDVSQWNTYAVLWTPEEYVYYVNWVPTYYVSTTGGDISATKLATLASTGNKLIPDVPMNFFFSTEVAKGVAWAELWAGILQEDKLPDSMDVDYFAWYPLPE